MISWLDSAVHRFYFRYKSNSNCTENKLQTKKPDHSLNSDRFTATTNIPISWLITMTSCPRSSRLMMPSTLLTSLTKRRKNTVNTISSTMPGTTRQTIWRIGREPLGASRMQKGKILCWAMMAFWSTTRWNDCNVNHHRLKSMACGQTPRYWVSEPQFA